MEQRAADRGPRVPRMVPSMKARLYRLATTMAAMAVVIEALGAGRKW